MNKTLVVLAAGMGSRYGGLKQMDPVGPSGEFLIDYAVYDAIQAGFNRVIFVIRKDMAEDFNATVGERLHPHVPVEYVFQNVLQVPAGVYAPATRKKPWGTGHALLIARELVSTPFVAINADDFYGRSAFQMASDSFAQSAGDANAYGVVTYRLLDTLPREGGVSRGVCRVTDDGYLDRIVERLNVKRVDGQVQFSDDGGSTGYLSGKEPASMNMWAFKPSIFQHLEEGFRTFIDKAGASNNAEFYLVDVVDKVIRERKAKVKVCASVDSWFGVTNPEDRPVVQQKIGYLVDQGVYPASLWSRG